MMEEACPVRRRKRRVAMKMADYVLVHGGHMDGSVWGKVVPGGSGDA